MCSHLLALCSAVMLGVLSPPPQSNATRGSIDAPDRRKRDGPARSVITGTQTPLLDSSVGCPVGLVAASEHVLLGSIVDPMGRVGPGQVLSLMRSLASWPQAGAGTTKGANRASKVILIPIRTIVLPLSSRRDLKNLWVSTPRK